METELTSIQKDYATKLEIIADKYFEQVDIDELRNKEEFTIEVFFDTFYILSMIQGYWELQIGEEKTDESKFSDDTFLVKALAFLGYIDNIKIFLPHIAELADQLKKSYILPPDDITEKDINAFLSEINLVSLEGLKEINKKNQLREYLEIMAPKAEIIFKANYVLSELKWNKRSNRLFYGESGKESIISYDNQKFNPIKHLQSNLFKKIESAISTGDRANLTINNFRDTMALCMFKEKIPDRRDDPKTLPLFYLSYDIYSRLTEDILKEFTYIHKKGKKIVLIKDTEYFIIDAIFSEPGGSTVNDKLSEKIKDIKKSLDIYRDINVPFPASETQPLIKKWEQYRHFDFFQRIWNDEKGGFVPLNENIKELLKYNFLAENENTFSSLLEKEKKSIRRAFEDKARDFVFVEGIWDEVSKIKRELRNLFNNTSRYIDVRRVDIFRDEGMTRFSLPEGEVGRRVKMLWEGLLESHQHNDKDDHYLKVELTKLIYDGFFKSPSQIDFDKILIAISILYVFRLNDIIIKIVEKLNFPYQDRYQIGLIYAASMYKYAKRQEYLDKIDKVINDLEGCNSFDSNYKLWIGLGYVKFNVWKTLTTPKKVEDYSDDLELLRKKYLKDGIKLTKRAYTFLTKHKDAKPEKNYRTIKYYYTLNNLIYYTVESKDVGQITTATFYQSYVKDLEECQLNSEYRQSRFSDTIARYYLTKSFLSNDDESKASNLRKAHKRIEEAIDYAVLRDERFEVLKDEIENEYQVVNERLTRSGGFSRDIRWEQ